MYDYWPDLQLKQTSLYRKWPGKFTSVPSPSGRGSSRDKKQTDSSYSTAPETDGDVDGELKGVAKEFGSVRRLPGWKSNELQVRTRLLAAVRSRRHRSWHLVNTCIGGDASRTWKSGNHLNSVSLQSVSTLQKKELNNMTVPHRRRSLGAVDGAISRRLIFPIQSCKTFELPIRE